MRISFFLRKIAVAIGLLTLAFSAQVSYAQSASQVDEIIVSGNSRVSTTTILSYLPISLGDKVTSATLNSAIENLFETKLFEDVSLSVDGNVLAIAVVENPIVNRINIEGNDVLKDEALLAELNIQPRRIYTD